MNWIWKCIKLVNALFKSLHLIVYAAFINPACSASDLIATHSMFFSQALSTLPDLPLRAQKSAKFHPTRPVCRQLSLDCSALWMYLMTQSDTFTFFIMSWTITENSSVSLMRLLLMLRCLDSSPEQIPAIDLLPNEQVEVSVSSCVNRFDWFTYKNCSY